ncbi:CoA transferase [Pusillimonas caeni]|uniref:CaiB/BaiF CoA transferase family protein n=1 Tax=Pusillimonas caeni TaxID=1348472 RepID=UPI000E59F6E3|nr:CoA transferase [Pusillimonas caeni]TFL10213.1 CoA transferase [Pusillimonas caeni]
MLSVQPLKGVTVLEMGHSVAGPYAGLILAEMGAEVIKLEKPGDGDYARGWGPPFWKGDSAIFHGLNRNKSSISADLSDPEQADAIRNLIHARVDVFVHNMRFGALDRLGFGARDLTAAKPDLIYCNIGAFGSKGPLKERPGYDPLMQAFSGMMSILGEDGRPPVRVGVSIIDMASGMWAAIGILAALYERQQTGKGGVVDCSLLETALAWMLNPITSYQCSGELPKRRGSSSPDIVPYQAFPVQDGYIMVAAGNDKLFRKLCEAIDLPDLADNPKYRINKDRVVNRVELIDVLTDVFRRAPSAHWFARLDAAGIPNGPIHTVDQVVTHPQVDALGMLQQVSGEDMRLLGLPISFDGARAPLTHVAPGIGKDNASIRLRAASAN